MVWFQLILCFFVFDVGGVHFASFAFECCALRCFCFAIMLLTTCFLAFARCVGFLALVVSLVDFCKSSFGLCWLMFYALRFALRLTACFVLVCCDFDVALCSLQSAVYCFIACGLLFVLCSWLYDSGFVVFCYEDMQCTGYKLAKLA